MLRCVYFTEKKNQALPAILMVARSRRLKESGRFAACRTLETRIVKVSNKIDNLKCSEKFSGLLGYSSSAVHKTRIPVDRRYFVHVSGTGIEEESSDIPDCSPWYTWTAPHQAKAVKFLRMWRADHKTGPGIPVRAQKVEELLLGIVNTNDLEPRDGSLGLNLLEAAKQSSDESTLYNNFPKLFSLTSEILIQCRHPEALRHVDRLFWDLVQRRDRFFSPELSYNSTHVNAVFGQLVISHATASTKARAKKGLDLRTKRRIDKYISIMKSLWGDAEVPLSPSPEAYHAIILFFCYDQNPEQAYELLMELVSKHASGIYPISFVLRTSSFAVTIAAFASQGKLQKAQDIIDFMLESDDNLIPKPDSFCFNALMDGYVKSGKKNAGYEAMQLLERMRELHDAAGLQTSPTEYSYNICINAWANTPGSDSAQQAEGILRRLIEEKESGGDVGPTAASFATVMNAWATSNHKYAPEKVESVFQVFEKMALMSDGQVELSIIPFTILIKTWGLAAKNRGHSGSELCYRKIFGAINRMRDLQISPTAETNMAIINALQMVSPIHGALYFLNLEQLYRRGKAVLSTNCFNSGINSIALLNMPDLEVKAAALLKRMLHYARGDQGVAPNVSTFNTVLKIMSRSSSEESAQDAQDLLMQMHQMHFIKPDRVSYLTCVLAWGRSSVHYEGKFERIKEILIQYEESYKKGKLADEMSVVPFNAALSVCHHNTDSLQNSRAHEMALYIMTHIRSSEKIHPDDKTYLGFLRTIGSMAQDKIERDRLIASEFRACIHDGLVTQEILDTVEQYIPGMILKLLKEDRKKGEPSNSPIPRKWRKNAGPHKK
jgi:hypothetical protein